MKTKIVLVGSAAVVALGGCMTTKPIPEKNPTVQGTHYIEIGHQSVPPFNSTGRKRPKPWHVKWSITEGGEDEGAGATVGAKPGESFSWQSTNNEPFLIVVRTNDWQTPSTGWPNQSPPFVCATCAALKPQDG